MKGLPIEDTEQTMVMRWAAGQEHEWPELALLFHVPNGGFRGRKAGAQMKRLGAKPGVPDLALPVARGGFHGLFIEMKRMQDGTVSRDQREWHARLTEQGYLVSTCRGYEEAVCVLRDYLAADGAANDDGGV